MSARPNRSAGFSLLEVVVALAILALSLMAIFDLNAGAVASHVYVKRLTVATLLARSKMTDLEQKLYDEGFSNDDDEESGDFSEEGWPSFKWRAKIIAPRTQGVSPQQLIGGLLNLPLGDGEGGGDALGPLGALLGGGGQGGGGLGGLGAMLGGAGGAAGGAGGGALGALGALGPAAGLMQGQFTQMVDQLTKSVREVHLTVTWKDGKLVESFDLVTHVVSLGPGSDRNGGTAPPGQLGIGGGGGGTGGEVMVNQTTGAPVPNPRRLPDGRMVDPADGVTPVVPISQWAQARQGLPGAFDPGRIPAQLIPQGTGVLEKRPRSMRVKEAYDE